MSRSRTAHHVLLLGALAYLTPLGCTPPSASRQARSAQSLYQISRAEIDAENTQFATAYDLVKALRPTMLVTRDIAPPLPPSAVPWQRRGIRIVLDGQDFGGVESLTMIPATTVLDVRWLSPLDATTRYGTGHTNGAIVITTRTGKR
jgi:hypothetical protein